MLPVVVTDKQGRYISDLATQNFAVFDNGRRVPIQLFSNEDTPVTIGLVIDASGSMRPKIGEVVAATMAFARASNPEDELFAVYFNDDVAETTMRDQPFLKAGDLPALESAITSIIPDGRTALYDGLMRALDHLSQGSRARKALIVISDGGDNASDAKQDDVLKRARNSNAAIYTVGIFDDDDDDKNPRVLKALAQTTGGERFLPRSPGDCDASARASRVRSAAATRSATCRPIATAHFTACASWWTPRRTSASACARGPVTSRRAHLQNHDTTRHASLD